MRYTTIIYLLLHLIVSCKGQFSKAPYNDYERKLRLVPANDMHQMVIVKDWEKMDSMTFLRLKNVEKIVIGETDTIPTWLYYYQNLRGIWATNKAIKTLPKKVGMIVSLKVLDVTKCSIIEIPETIGNLKLLESIWFNDNKITGLPKEIGLLHNLRGLRIAKNQLQDLPETVCNLKALDILDLSNNKIEKLPDCIDKIISLTNLRVGDNQLTDLPETIYNLPKLQFIDLRGNPLKNPSEIKKRFKEKGVRCEVDE